MRAAMGPWEVPGTERGAGAISVGAQDPVDTTVAPAPPAPPPSAGIVARVAAVGALVAAVVLIVLVLFGGGPSYTLKANFEDAGGLVTGDDVLIGPARVGSVQSIGLSDDGQAQVKIGLDSDASPMHQGTIARVYENSLSGIANKYVVLVPGPQSAPAIHDGGEISAAHTYSEVSLDEVFDAINGPTRNGLRGFIRGEAASIAGKAEQANQTLRYLAPGLESTSNVTAELTRSEPTFDNLLVQGAQSLHTLASRANELTQLVAHTSEATGAIASQSHNLETALSLLPPALNHSVRTFAGLRSTLDALTPLVEKSIPASRRLEPFAVALHTLTDASIPTLAELSALIKNPSGGGDLIKLLSETPSLARIAIPSFPRMIHEFNISQNQLDYFREYTPDVVAALGNIGQTSANYDANGHYARTQPLFGAFGVDGANQLATKPAFDRYQGLTVVHGRCPGGAVQRAPDGSNAQAVPGCNPNNAPAGP
jgi:phospholipid/cholesterol/gamma-HCH transport system substrate-binding protein